MGNLNNFDKLWLMLIGILCKDATNLSKDPFRAPGVPRISRGSDSPPESPGIPTGSGEEQRRD